MTLPVKVDLRQGIRKWLDLGNFDLGDCTVAAFYHLEMVHNLAAASTWKKLLYRLGYRPPHDKFVVHMYTEYLATLNEKPSGTQGVDPEGFFTWLKSRGRITDFQSVQVTPDTIKQAMIDWKGVLLCVRLTQRAWYNALTKQPWVIQPGDTPDPKLGHAVALVSYDNTNYGVVTWGRMKVMDEAFLTTCCYAAWVFK